MNKLFNNQINLNKEEHKYELKDKPDFEFISLQSGMKKVYDKIS